LYRFSQRRKEAGFNEASNDHMPACIGGLDFEDASQYRDEFHSPASSATPDEAGIDESDSSRTGLCLSMIDNNNIERGIEPFPSRDIRRRQTSFAKHNRMSLFASAVNPADAFSHQRKSLFVRQSCLFPVSNRTLLQESAPEFFSQHNAAIDGSTCENFNTIQESPLDNSEILRTIFDFLQEDELLLVVGLVSTKWADASTHSHANLMLSSVACIASDDDITDSRIEVSPSTVTSSMERSWDYLTTSFPWACFLSEGAYKRVYKVFNHQCQAEEAVSVMDVKQIQSTGNINVVGAELAVSVMLSSLVRRGICPNFVATRGVFSCRHEPPESHWGSANNRKPKGKSYSSSKVKRRPKKPKQGSHFQYIRMELCDEGDAEEFLKRQPDESVTPFQARNLLFQISFALHAAADKFSLKHYDVKLLNIFLQRIPTKNEGNVILRYGLGEHTFSLQSSREEAIIAKLADYGTANVDCATSGQHVTIAQFTTLENTPPEFMIMGDEARQGHGHDCFGLGLCMLHLFAGHAPYEELLDGVTCPVNLKRELRRIWENEEETQYTVVRSIVLADVYKDEFGDIIEGEPDETLYDTLYKYLVLFGIPNDSSPLLNSKVMIAVKNTLSSESRHKKGGRGRNRKMPCDTMQFISDQNRFSLSHGNNIYVGHARTSLQAMDGGMDLLLSLVKFNPLSRASALDVLNSSFMESLREIPYGDNSYKDEDEVLSFTAFST
jgi:serine/threonine protein kinase